MFRNPKFKNNDLIKFFNEKKIKNKIKKIKFLNLNKKIIFLENKYKKPIIFKVAQDSYSRKLLKNEERGYLNKKIKSKFYRLPKYRKYISNDNIYINQISYLGNKKGNYFNVQKFYKKKNRFSIQKLNIYFEKLLKNNLFRCRLNNLQIKIYKKILLEKFKNYPIPIDVSHGDFVPWNTSIYLSENYVYDLEFYSQNRVFCYDIIHWYFIPLIQKFYKYKLNYFLENKLIFKLIFLIIKNAIKKNFLENYTNKQIELFFLLFLIEKESYYIYLLNLKNLKKTTNKEYFKICLFFKKILHFYIKKILSKY